MTTRTEPVEGGYRCTECGHGKRLWAYAGANVYGPLSADGSELDEHQVVEEWGIHEDSIQCTEHPGATLERFVDGKWCRWWSCPECKGRGRVRVGECWRAPDGYACDAKGRPAFAGKSHEGWFPVEEMASA